jgi:hypothetical protein
MKQPKGGLPDCLDANSLDAASLGSTNLGASPSRRPKYHAPSPPAPLHRRRPFTVAPQVAPDPQTPQQTPQPPLKAAYIGKRPQSRRKRPPHRMGQHQIDIDKRDRLARKG